MRVDVFVKFAQPNFAISSETLAYGLDVLYFGARSCFILARTSTSSQERQAGGT